MTLFYNPEMRAILAFWLLFICLGFVYSIVRTWQQKRYAFLAVMLVLFAGCDIYWQFLNANSYYTGDNHPYYLIDTAPVLLIVVINLALSALCIAVNIHIIKWQKKHVNAISVKESLDTLSSGVCFYDESGRIYLANEAMISTAKVLEGETLLNGKAFWAKLQCEEALYESENKLILKQGDKVLGFTKYKGSIGSQIFNEILSADVTEEYEQNMLLEEKNAELAEQNRLLEEYKTTLAQVIREREIMQSKAEIHDNMNILLMSTLKSIDDYSESQAAEVISKWKSNILELEKASEKYQKNPLETLENLASSLGIKLVFSGEFPKIKENARLLTVAVSECMTNALRHAQADTLFVASSDRGAVITNNGKAPDKPIKEGGGLSNLRKRADKENAEIIIKSQPEFSLELKYKKEA